MEARDTEHQEWEQEIRSIRRLGAGDTEHQEWEQEIRSINSGSGRYGASGAGARDTGDREQQQEHRTQQLTLRNSGTGIDVSANWK